MRTNIEIDDELMDAAMRAGPFKTKKEAVEEGLKLLRRRAAYRDLLALRGKLHWEDPLAEGAAPPMVQERRAPYSAANSPAKAAGRKAAALKAPVPKAPANKE
ncbi:MAG: type II toxin-antitoxin system VapB family antitoxin [Betaproteobacteria bacterium]|nr:type II toxin-antitoxin system VapB family antitoxin [Betaproteobacteria bacterium]